MWRKSSAAIVLILALAFGASPLVVPDFGGFDPHSFPVPQIDPPVQPAGYAFAIWGPIFLWLVVGAAYGVWRHRADESWMPMRAPLAVSLGVGAIWLPVAVFSPVWATILIWAMLVPALFALLRAPEEQRSFAALPVGLYAGWLSAAACVAIGLLLGGFGVVPEATAAYAMIGLATLIACAVQWRATLTPTYGIAAIWAFAAITAQNGPNTGVGSAGLVAAAVLMWPTARSVAGFLKKKSGPFSVSENG